MRPHAALFQEARTLGSGGCWDSLGAPRWVERCGESLELGGPSLVRARLPTQDQAWGQSPQLAMDLSLRLVLGALPGPGIP